MACFAFVFDSPFGGVRSRFRIVFGPVVRVLLPRGMEAVTASFVTEEDPSSPVASVGDVARKTGATLRGIHVVFSLAPELIS